MDFGDLYFHTREWAQGYARRKGFEDVDGVVDEVSEEIMAGEIRPKTLAEIDRDGMGEAEP